MERSQSTFQSTRWTHFKQLKKGNDVEASRAMNVICRTYWKPLYHFALSCGCMKEDAEDVVQGFLSTVSGNQFFKLADPNKGRLRSYLLHAYKQFIYDYWRKRSAKKRGGDNIIISLEDDFHPGTDLTPSLIYDQHWAAVMVENAKSSLRQRYEKIDQIVLYEALIECVDGSPIKNQKNVAAELDMSETALKSAIHRIRKRFGEEVRIAVAETVSCETEINDELYWLAEVLGK